MLTVYSATLRQGLPSNAPGVPSRCAPSRNSFLSGRLPATTRAWNFRDHFREKGLGDTWRSLPQYIKELGYATASSGKVFHAMLPPNNDYSQSWNLKPFTPHCLAPNECSDSIATFKTHAERHESARCVQHGWSWCALSVDKDEDRDDYQLEDQRVASHCIRQLNELVEQDGQKPFFLVCGFHKPHVPWLFPAEFLQDFPANIMDIPLAAKGAQAMPEGTPSAAFRNRIMDAKVEFGGGDNSTDLDMTRRYNRRAYYACVNYIDHTMGKVVKRLQELDKVSSTVIVVTADHGWHLGEQGMWGKMTNFENALRVPHIVRSPRHEQSQGKVTDELAELVDLYSTLAQLAGLPHPKDEGQDVNETSLLRVFENPEGTDHVKHYALSQIAKPSWQHPQRVSPGLRRNETEIMGYSLRSRSWRYTAWFKFDPKNQVPIKTHILGRELYDHREDGNQPNAAQGGFDSCQEMKTLAKLTKHQEVVRTLHDALLQRITLKSVEGVERFYPQEWLVAMDGRDLNYNFALPSHDQQTSELSNRISSVVGRFFLDRFH